MTRRDPRPLRAVALGTTLVLVLAGAARAIAGDARPLHPSAASEGVAASRLGSSHQALPNGAPAAIPTPPATTERDSVTSSGGQLDDTSGGSSAVLASMRPDQAISADGRWVVFVSAASNLGAGASHPALFRHDRQSGSTTAIPWLDGGPFPVGVTAAEPTVSADGSVVAFTAVLAPNVQTAGLVTKETTPFVLVWDGTSNTTTVASLTASKQPTAGWQPSISADGRYIAYTTWISPDKTPPVLTNLSAAPSCFSSAGTATVTVTATDPDDAVTSITIVVTPPGASSFSASMTPGGNNTWTYVIQGSTSWSPGFVDYTLTAVDGHANSASASSTHDETGTNYLTFAPNGCIF